MANQLNCLRCGTGMRFIRREKFQLGQTGWVLGDLPNLFAGAMEIEIYVCPKCGKLEFFQPGSDKFAGTADEAKTGSVIGDASGFPITKDFLKKMKKRWF